MNHFANVHAFWLLILPIIIRSLLPAVKGLHGDALRIPFLRDIKNINSKAGGNWGIGTSSKKNYSLVLFVIFALLVFAFARPQAVGEPIRIKNYSRDILMVTDISTSMLEPDFSFNKRRIDRLTAVKIAAGEFIDKRVDDRIGMILFGTRAYLQAPLTFDKKSVKEILYTMDAGMAGNSTSIGDALGLALKSLKDNKDLEKKVIILLTDGENNDGALSVLQAVTMAKAENVKIYTIGVGSESAFGSLFKMAGLKQDIDDSDLKLIAGETMGRYFKASDTKGLQNIYNEIDKLEPSENEEKFVQEASELYYIPLLAALILTLMMIYVMRRNKNV